jgi:hypothetical protein
LSTSVIPLPVFGVLASLHSETSVSPGPHGGSPHAQTPDVACPGEEQQCVPVQLAADRPPADPTQAHWQKLLNTEHVKPPQEHVGPAA